MKNVKLHQMYLGRYLIFLIVGLLQSSLICLGDLFYLGIQCKHPFLFVLAGWISSIVYVNIIYTLTVSFGDIGKAISVVLLVVQIAGTGGTFPRSGSWIFPGGFTTASVYAQYGGYERGCWRCVWYGLLEGSWETWSVLDCFTGCGTGVETTDYSDE